MSVADNDAPPPPTDQDAPDNVTPLERARAQRNVGTRVPPHDLAAEESLIGACLLPQLAGDGTARPSKAIRVGQDAGITSSDFYRPSHGHMWDAIVGLADLDIAPDIVTVSDALHRDGLLQACGGTAHLSTLADQTPFTSNAGRYARIVEEYSRLRALINSASQIAELGYSLPDDVGAVVEKAVSLVTSVKDRATNSDLFHAWTPAELLDADTEFRWLVKGMYATPTYGMTVGEMKTAKSTISGITAMSVAAGIPVLGKFHVDQACPVILYVGEGGRIPHTRFLSRVAAAVGLDDWRDVPIHPRYETAALNSPKFQATLARDLDTIRPGLVIIDPYYSFHGSTADARNLHEEAEVLNAVSAPVVEAGAVLDIVHHFNRSDGKGLKRITMAGGGEWVDTWRLLSHRSDPDVDNGHFRLSFEIGSRQWGGSSWDLDLELGRFNPDLGHHDGHMSYSISRPTEGGSQTGDAALCIIKACADEPLEYTRENLAKLAGINLSDARRLVDKLARDKKIKPEIVPVTDAIGRTQQTWRFRATSVLETSQDVAS